MRIARKMFRSAGMAALGILIAAVAMVSAAPAQADQPASMVVGRGRVVIHLPAPVPGGPDRYVFLVDGVNQCTPTCGGFPVAKFVPGGKFVLGPADLGFGVPAGQHRIEVRFPGNPDMLDRQVTVLPPNRQQDTIDNWVLCFHLPFPTDPTLHCAM
ncbi:hypothetical protein ABIA39_002289 [Nocardia sp. GAS34]|uniref:hypothetical protein n=1 Tax=unclassified Nocardia TaxID=2637762 RepID=UPI003D191E84